MAQTSSARGGPPRRPALTMAGMSAKVGITIAVLLVASALITACSGTPAATLVTPSAVGSTTPAPTAAAPGSTASAIPTGQASPDAPASVSIERPADGATVPSGSIEVAAKVGGMRLVDKIGQAPSAGEGHLIYYVGVDFVPTDPGESAATAPGTYAASAQTSYTWHGLDPGTYGVWVQVVNNDGTPLSPAVTAHAAVTVR
jgi:hypothetical protein